MRIITGSAKGRKIKIPKVGTIRPAQDKVRQAVFSMLYGLVEGSHVLDLFAGSGSYGLEALSRGAKNVIFVDINKRCTETIKENLRALGFGSKGEVIKEDAQRFVERYSGTSPNELGQVKETLRVKESAELQSDKATHSEKFNLIFLDPPYEMGTQTHLLKSLTKILAPKGVIIFSHAKETKIPEETNGLKVIRERSYGATTVSFLAKS